MRDAAVKSVAVGFFDGVHLGHRAILRGADVALTFENHPLSVLRPESAPRLIMSWQDRAKTIRALGVRQVTALDFTKELASSQPEDFLQLMRGLVAPNGLSIRCGENWRFGANGAGDADFLRAHGVEVEVVPYAEYKGERISSTRIRTALEAGRLADANAMLGHPFAAAGTVFHGKGEGTRIGFPTVNLHLDTAIRLPLGVYAVEVEKVERVEGVEKGERGVRGIANYGVAPTMSSRAWREPCLEVHFVECGNVEAWESGMVGCVRFLNFIRPERTFESEEALVRQIALDVKSLEV